MSTYPDDNRGSGNIPPTRVVAVANHDLRAAGGFNKRGRSVKGKKVPIWGDVLLIVGLR